MVKRSRPRMRLKILSIGLMLAMSGSALPAEENPFAARIMVNDAAITGFELTQRALFLTLLRSPGDAAKVAEERLIEDKLRLQAADAAGMKPTAEEIDAGMAEFAGRASLTTEEFVKAIGEAGVAPESFRDFVTAGLAWRALVRDRFGTQASVSEADIDRALALTSQRGAVRVLLSELILPATPDVAAQSAELAKTLSRDLRGETAFAIAARKYSVAPTRDQGGRINWLPLANLPPQLGPMLLALTPGQVSEPVPVTNAIALFLLRAIDDGGVPAASAVSVDYAEFLIPGGRGTEALARAAVLRTEVRTCGDLYLPARGLPEDQLQRVTQTMDQVPTDIGIELARLDEGESSIALERGGNLVFLMLCARTPVTETPPARDEVRARLINEKLEGLSEAYLAQLVANAHILRP